MSIKKISSNTKIFLIGFMGCGKTFLGKQIASKLNLFFFMCRLSEASHKGILTFKILKVLAHS